MAALSNPLANTDCDGLYDTAFPHEKQQWGHGSRIKQVSQMSTFKKIHSNTYPDYIRVMLAIVWWSCFGTCWSMSCRARHGHVCLLCSSSLNAPWGGNEGKKRGAEMRNRERGGSSVSETLCHGLDEEMKCAASIRRWAKIKGSPTLSHMVLFDQCFAFFLFAFFSLSFGIFSLFFAERPFCFSPSEIPACYWSNDVVARKVRGLGKPYLPPVFFS